MGKAFEVVKVCPDVSCDPHAVLVGVPEAELQGAEEPATAWDGH